VAKVSSHSFHCYTPQVYENCPTELKETYSGGMFTDAEDGKGRAMMFTKPLADEVMKDETNFSELERHIEEAFNRSFYDVTTTHVRFVESNPSDIPWPDMDMGPFRCVFGPPKIDKLTVIQIFQKAFDLVHPYLQRDLFSKGPGKSIKMDGTFQRNTLMVCLMIKLPII
jgi:hypothetical protein